MYNNHFNYLSGYNQFYIRKCLYTDEVIKRFKKAREFTVNKAMITCISFSVNGQLMVTSSLDDQICVYDCNTGLLKRAIHVDNYGADILRPTSFWEIFFSSTKLNDDLRLLDVNENKYIRFFKGHDKRVTSLAICPYSRRCLSTSLDRTAALWDTRVLNKVGMINHNSDNSVVAFDPSSLNFALGVNGSLLKLYDCRNVMNGPIKTFKYANVEDWSQIEFSSDGNFCLISTNNDVIRLIDAKLGDPVQLFSGFANTVKIPLRASISPDSKYVLSGSTDCLVHIWNLNTGQKVKTVVGDKFGPVQCVAFHPKSMLFATASYKNTSFWRPDIFE
ncbi:WD repeat-containing protein 82-like [Teleopsis dalmanni]|uniref:WD repeat-containing protein 82-like n=1 Tax=Teleopsis dalmanni TaxID=139649 RepID=UPI0018CFD762|nr:WD repeat-containing protein 82-like [Teleopsis dalmanni]